MKATNNPLSHLTLGQATEYPEHYDAGLLKAVPRALNREELGLNEGALPFHGEDWWTGYELSWLNAKGKPQVAILQARVPADSPNLIESKSFKLYLNGFIQSRMNDTSALAQMLTRDLSQCAGAKVSVEVHALNDFAGGIQQLPGDCIDDLDIEINHYQLAPTLLSYGDNIVAEQLHSHLLKSNCLITNQPDWGSVLIDYQGPQIDRESLLRYLVSFRQHNEFHEQCVERIFCDIQRYCRPTKLSVCARYTRRGGLDINPFRSNFAAPYPNLRLVRQ